MQIPQKITPIRLKNLDPSLAFLRKHEIPKARRIGEIVPIHHFGFNHIGEVNREFGLEQHVQRPGMSQRDQNVGVRQKQPGLGFARKQGARPLNLSRLSTTRPP